MRKQAGRRARHHPLQTFPIPYLPKCVELIIPPSVIDSHGSPHPYPPSDSPVTFSNSPSSPQAGLACMRNLFSPLGTMLSHISGQARPTCILSSRCTGYLLFGLYHPLIVYGMRHTTNIDHLNPVLFLLHRHHCLLGSFNMRQPHCHDMYI
jgi:hypothetical protein